MKIKNTKWVALLAMAGFAISAHSAQASVPINSGDLIFGVRSTLGTNTNIYLFDLGAAPASTSTVATGLGADLTALFGAGWATDTTLRWSVSGYDPATGDIIGSKAETTYGTQSAPVNNGSFSATQINVAKGKMDNVDTQYGNGSTTDSPFFTTGGTSTSGGVAVLKNAVNGYNTFAPSGYTLFGSSFEAAGFSKALDVYDVAGPGAGDVTYGGTFIVDSSGDVIFSAAPPSVATPEAGSGLALLSLGLGCLVPLRRRLAAQRA